LVSGGQPLNGINLEDFSEKQLDLLMKKIQAEKLKRQIERSQNNELIQREEKALSIETVPITTVLSMVEMLQL